jgi:hypothetical protein
VKLFSTRDYGKNKDGYWTYAHFEEQMEDFMDCLECLHPDFPLVMEVDWSSGHAVHRAGCLSVTTMNVGFSASRRSRTPPR